jgi:hypothetical protein
VPSLARSSLITMDTTGRRVAGTVNGDGFNGVVCVLHLQ